MANKLYQESDVQNIANAIRTKNGSSDTYKVGEMANAILAIPTGGEVEEKDVNFYDYDGTLLYSYTAQEFANLTEFPENPNHTGLIAQGWNWTLASAKTHVSNNRKLDIGQNYKTDDGKTRLYVEIQELKKHVYVGFGINGTATINWGDNSTSTLSGTSSTLVVYAEHTYAQTGNYVVTIESDADINILGSAGSYLFTEQHDATNQNRAVLNCVKKIELGNNVTMFSSYGLSYLGSLESITIPTSVTSIGTYSFFYSNNIKFLVIPNGITDIPINFCQNCIELQGISLPQGCDSIGNYVFYNCYNLKRVTIPQGTTTLGINCFQNCYTLEEVILPNSLTKIGNYCFASCYNLQLEIPSSITSIGTYCFQGNMKAKEFTIPSAIHTVGNYLFSTCSATVKIIFLGAIDSVGASAFYQNASLVILDFTNCERVPALSNKNALTGCVYATIVVPDSLYSTWIAATNWSTYASQIVKESEWNA